MTDIGEIALYFIYIRDQLKIYHWQTKNYARHVASDSFVSSLSDKNSFEILLFTSNFT